MSGSLQFTTGVPTLSLFRSGNGDVLVIDKTGAIAYFADPDTGIITALGGGGGGAGTVTHTAGALLANAVVIGNGAADEKTLAALGAAGTALMSNGPGSPPSFQTLPAFTYATIAPVSPSVGDRWVDSSAGILYVYTNDSTSTQWVEF